MERQEGRDVVRKHRGVKKDREGELHNCNTTAIQLQFVSCSDDPSQGKTDLFTLLMLPT